MEPDVVLNKGVVKASQALAEKVSRSRTSGINITGGHGYHGIMDEEAAKARAESQKRVRDEKKKKADEEKEKKKKKKSPAKKKVKEAASAVELEEIEERTVAEMTLDRDSCFLIDDEPQVGNSEDAHMEDQECLKEDESPENEEESLPTKRPKLAEDECKALQLIEMAPQPIEVTPGNPTPTPKPREFSDSRWWKDYIASQEAEAKKRVHTLGNPRVERPVTRSEKRRHEIVVM